MKKTMKLFVLALAFTIIMGAFCLNIGATNTEVGADPNALTPGSDKVIFIKDAPRDEKYQVVGELSGDGTGTDADNPLKASDHEKFDPSAERKRYDYTTAFYQATELLAETGGTIVICGPVHLGIMECADNGASSVRDAYTANFKNNVIKFTSVYDGVDYRETAGAKLSICTPAMVTVLGSSIWENIDIETIGTERAITFDDFCTLVGEGVKCYPADSAFEDVATNYVSLAAGHRHASSKNENPTLTVKSGTYNKITAGMWGTSNTLHSENINSFLTLEGTTRVLGIVSGTVQAKSNYSGNVNITIKGGTYECDINGVGPTGLTNLDGIVNITISGGNFKNAWSINQSAVGALNNMPAKTTLDFSGWTGDKLGLAYANTLVTDITDIKYPDGVTAEELQKILETAPADDPAEDTQPAETKPSEPQATEPQSTTPAATSPTAQPTTPVTSATTPTPTTPSEEENSGSNIGLIVGIIVGIVVIAVVAVIIIKKKKA